MIEMQILCTTLISENVTDTIKIPENETEKWVNPIIIIL